MKPGNAGGGKGPQFKTDAARSEGPGDWATYQLRTVFRNCRWRYTRKRRLKPAIRFYALYDKISREDILAHAWAQCRSNKGAPGVDGQDFADVEAYGVQRWLGELALALRNEEYRPDPIRRVFIPKANGKLRPLGISTLRDRVCMTAAMLVLEPIFEADLPPEQYAYRPGRNAQQAVIDVKETLFRGHPEVVDADLADYFGSIPHAELMLSLARRIVDARVLHLIKMWLECAVEETDDRGRKTRTTEAKDQRRGIPQGSPISPLLANLYMRRFVLGWKKLGLEQSLGSRIVTYADDLVILCRKGKAEEALSRMREIMGKLKLTVNEEKTRICKVPEGEFDFLGYTFGRLYSKTTGKARLGMWPSKKSIRRMVEKVHDLTDLKTGWQETTEKVAKLNRALRGWANYFQVGTRQPGISRARQLHRTAVAPVVAQQVQAQATQGRDLSTLAPLRALRARSSDRTGARPVVGEGVRSCPRAGCGKSACPVR